MEVTHTKIDGQKLKYARLQRGWTVEHAAKQLGVAVQTYIRWEKGTVKPHPRALVLLCDTFQLTLEQLGIQLEKLDASESANSSVASILSNIIPGSSESTIETQPIWKVPTFFTSFVGRQQEVKQVSALLTRPDVRLVTLVGAGGMGKTRLGVQVAEEMHDFFADGVYFVPLVTVTDAALVLPTIAKALDISESESRPIREQVKFALSDKHTLLLLDNFEQVIVAAPIIEDLLISCPHLKALITSRVVLHLQAERLFLVSPLALPKPEDLANLDTLTQLASVSLFAQRAQAVLPDFAVTSENAQIIAEICVRLDGLPLSIELAAARIKLLPPRALLERLSQSSQILKSHLWALPERHHTLYNTVKWSYNLLDEQEQRLFRSLSVFRGGYTLEAVESFYGIQDPTLDVLDKITSLLDNSLIQRSSEEPRFTMLEFIREYGFVLLQEHDEVEICQMAHARYYLNLVEDAEPRLKGAEQTNWLARLQNDRENINSALSWLYDHKETELLLRFCDAAGKFYGLKGEWVKEQEILKAALDLPMPAKPLKIRARVLRRAGHLAYRLKNLHEAQKLLEESVNISRELEDKQNLVGALSTLGWVLYRQNDVASASRLLKECVIVARECGDKWVIANALDSLGRLKHAQGETTEARSMLQEGTMLVRELLDRESLVRFLATLVSIEIVLGNIEHADDYAQECITLAQELGTKPIKALALDSVTEVALFKGTYKQVIDYLEERIRLAHELKDKSTVAIKQLRLGELALVLDSYEQAITPVQESLKFFRAQGDNPNIAAALDILGDIKRKQGDLEQAWLLYKEALQLDKEIANKRSIGKHLIGLAKVALEQNQPEQAAMFFAQAEHYLNPHLDMYPAQQSDYEQAVERTRMLLGEETFARAQSEADKMTLEQALLSPNYPC